ncbi:hypothetical protein J1N35_033372 [Gossypium stocksii]|uniref:Peptidase C14 caspase domain-containing protein n=1 Tax=Gossypium stocksii TaxID=47602 RepID=A0A9D3UQ22_9ROSI|nr:hypothetical protein J1N35_033372 [Gossypium stocksii]
MSRGTKRAVLVGCNYPKTQFSLHGCINDVEAIRGVILKFGFEQSDIIVLTDAPGSRVLPTGANIKDALNRMEVPDCYNQVGPDIRQMERRNSRCPTIFINNMHYESDFKVARIRFFHKPLMVNMKVSILDIQFGRDLFRSETKDIW